ENAEMIIAAKNNDNDELKSEIADLLYHIMVLCVNQGLGWPDVEAVLTERRSKLGNLKKIRSTDKNT
ncbi:MAG: phosphoribosyl-ATP diphosphatase, partial [Eubacterium sp.]|nr:phosphoribosyl-ATP diphosphatase [Eubacterium sp.]